MTESMNGNTEKLKAKLTQNLFKHYDKNNDNSLSFNEFKKLSRDFNLDDYDNQKARDLFAKIDSSSDKKISVEGKFKQNSLVNLTLNWCKDYKKGFFPPLNKLINQEIGWRRLGLQPIKETVWRLTIWLNLNSL